MYITHVRVRCWNCYVIAEQVTWRESVPCLGHVQSCWSSCSLCTLQIQSRIMMTRSHWSLTPHSIQSRGTYTYCAYKALSHDIHVDDFPVIVTKFRVIIWLLNVLLAHWLALSGTYSKGNMWNTHVRTCRATACTVHMLTTSQSSQLVLTRTQYSQPQLEPWPHVGYYMYMFNTCAGTKLAGVDWGQPGTARSCQQDYEAIFICCVVQAA